MEMQIIKAKKKEKKSVVEVFSVSAFIKEKSSL
jgi:hypothetical protein